MVYLSNFQTAGRAENAVAISAMVPKWYTGARRKDLAPKLSTLSKFHKQQITAAEFWMEYVDKIIYRHDLDQLATELDDKTLLCYCPKNELCHRLVLGLYLHIETGIEVQEIGGFGDILTVDSLDDVDPIVRYPIGHVSDNQDLVDVGIDDLVGNWRKLKEMNRLDAYASIV